MTSTRELEDSLPMSAPACEGDFIFRKLAIYTLLPLQAAELERLQQDLRDANDIEEDFVAKVAVQPRFTSLLDIYNHHIQTRDQDALFHPLYFIVADQNDWAKTGVLFVNLATSTEQRESFNGVCRCDLETATLLKANLDVGNMDWVDYKEMEADEFHGEDVYKNPRYYPSDPTATTTA